MQCSSCGAFDPRESENCSECQSTSLSAANSDSVPRSGANARAQERTTAKPKKERPRRPAPKSATGSRLIEFPGGGRVPQWRKELSERVREVQKRRALEGTTEALPVDPTNKQASRSPEPAQLGLVRPATAPAINPLVMKALLRIERAHRAPIQASPSYSRGGPALARQPEEVTEMETLPASIQSEVAAAATIPETVTAASATFERTEQSSKEHGLAVVPPQTDRAEGEATETSKPRAARLINPRVEDAALSYLENLRTANPVVAKSRDDRAGIPTRVMAAIVDLIVIAFASCPIAAGLELWGSDWNDLRVKGLMAGVTIVIGFLYLTISTGLAGRTLGMKLFRIRAVDVRTGLMPSGSQSARRAIGYIFSLATAGLGIFYGLMDAEHRTAHDHFSGTIVIQD
jgi:uncharacterized RDD family membrane protein YckC